MGSFLAYVLGALEVGYVKADEFESFIEMVTERRICLFQPGQLLAG